MPKDLRPGSWTMVTVIAVGALVVAAALLALFPNLRVHRLGGIAGGGRGGRSTAATSAFSTPAPSAAKGATLWEQFCAACHVVPSGAQQPLAPILISREYLGFATDQRLDSTISQGVAGTTMLGWGKGSSGMLDATQVQSLILYLRSMEASAPSDTKWKEGRKVPLP